MLKKLAVSLRRWGGVPEADKPSQPLIAGYHKTSPRAVRILLLAILAVATFAYGLAFSVVAPVVLMPFTVPLVVLAGLILWVLPPGQHGPTWAIEPLYVMFFAALLLWPNYLAVAILTLPWLTILRITAVPMVLCFLACISISQSFRDRMREILGADIWVTRLLIALAALWAASIVMSPDPGFAVNRYVVNLLNLIAIFFVSCFVFSRPGFADFWVRALLVILTIVCLFGIWEDRLENLPWAGHIPSFLKIDDPNVIKVLTPGYTRGEATYRVKATSSTPLGLSEILGLAVPFAMHFAFGKRAFLVRVAALLFIPLAVFVILLTDSRLGVVAACGSIMFYLLIWALLRWRQSKSSLLAPAIVLTYPLSFVAFIASTFLIGRLRVEFWGTGAQQMSTQGRLTQWNMGWPMIIHNPLGYGIGQAARQLNNIVNGIRTIDSYWLSVLLEIGPVGFVVFYGLMLRAAYRAARTAIDYGQDGELGLLIPMAVTLLNFVIVKAVLSQDANHSFIFMVLGGVLALAYRAKKSGQEAGRVMPSPPPIPTRQSVPRRH